MWDKIFQTIKWIAMAAFIFVSSVIIMAGLYLIVLSVANIIRGE